MRRRKSLESRNLSPKDSSFRNSRKEARSNPSLSAFSRRSRTGVERGRYTSNASRLHVPHSDDSGLTNASVVVILNNADEDSVGNAGTGNRRAGPQGIAC